tara:strand:+ start:45361 stop:45618 length:258 start_codon:yes stop_codon:yes gene_type:complete
MTRSEISIGKDIDNLKQSDWIRRETDKTDRRSSRIYRPNKCEHLKAEIETSTSGTTKEIEVGISDQELTELKKYSKLYPITLKKP